jgi:serine-type D-Ala-D-Ala carboxypeptidase/endopeptidase
MTEARFAEVDRVFVEAVARAHVPGVVFGVIEDGHLVHARGIGTLVAGDDVEPGPGDAFRIASMSKSFTGAALMRLVERGRVRLDEPIASYAPELAGWRGPTADAPELTLRHLVWMEAGLPTDDPWADRHLDATAGEMDALIAGGGTFAWTPGIAFEYSNLGWGLIGRVVERVTGAPVQRLIQDEVLIPLGLEHTRWTPDDLPAGTAVARGHRWDDGAWREEAPLGDGAIAPMGGLWSSVDDLARWVGFFLDAFPPRDEPDETGSLSRAGRREMQQLRSVESMEVIPPRRNGGGFTRLHGYGIGLMPTRDPVLGFTVGHSGGLPGFGSHMRWLPDRRLGIVAVGNVTYAPMGRACFQALEAMARAGALPAARPVEPTPTLTEAGARLHGLLAAWGDAEAAALFADNVDPDEPLGRRRREAEALVARLGGLGEPGAVVAETPLRGSMDLADGRARVEIWLNALTPTRLQFYEIKVDPPLIADPDTLGSARGVHVVLRPHGALAEGVADLQRGLVEHLGDPAAEMPAAHASLGAYGDLDTAPDAAERDRIAAVIAAWAAATPPLRLEAEGVMLLEGEGIPAVRLRAHDDLRAAFQDLRRRAHAGGLPAGSSDAVEDARWIFHLSLAYPDGAGRERWDAAMAWLVEQPTDGWADTVSGADLVTFDAGVERWLARYRLGGRS